MIAWLKQKIAWAVAGRELAELERWRVECGVAERWLAEFPDARYALDYVRGSAYYGGRDISETRDRMRRRRDYARKFDVDLAPLSPINATPKDIDEFSREWRAAYSAMPLLSLKTATLDQIESANDFDVVEQHMADVQSHAHGLFVDPPAPTHYTGIFPVPAKS